MKKCRFETIVLETAVHQQLHRPLTGPRLVRAGFRAVLRTSGPQAQRRQHHPQARLALPRQLLHQLRT
eukprot:scaffold1806_cov240-Pinguiococcus_pyrenoidosus.AAC.10